MSDSEPSGVEQAMHSQANAAVSSKRKCSPEQLERLARAREKALEKRAALAALRQKEKELADLALQERFRKAEQLEREFKERSSYGAGSKPSSKVRSAPAPPTPKQSKKHSTARKPPPPPVESCSSSEAEESEESEEEAPPPKSYRNSSKRSVAAPRMRTDPQDEWMQLARRVFPGL